MLLQFAGCSVHTCAAVLLMGGIGCCRVRGFGLGRRKTTLRQPTWCKLQPSGFDALASRVPAGDVPENLLFIAKPVAAGAAATGGTWL